MTRKMLLSIATAFSATALACPPAVARDADSPTEAPSAAKVMVPENVQWGPLNAARGDASPRAGNLWGDRTMQGASGFLVRFEEGFSSPPHIHNFTYRGLVIEGLVHNDDPAAAKMWLPAGSFWTQPAGECHITTARGVANLAYIEIDDGPYLVRPSDEAFDNGQRPINVHPSNFVWLDVADVEWLQMAQGPNAPQMAFLWSDPQQGEACGALLKLPAGFSGALRGNASPLRAVVIKGAIGHRLADGSEVQTLPPGSYFGSSGETIHRITNMSDGDAIVYTRSSDPFSID